MILPAPAEGFTWRVTPFGPALVCEPLEEVAPHVFTSRHWRLGARADARDDEQAWMEVTRAVAAEDLVRLRQVHGSRVALADEVSLGCPEADALVGANPSRALAVQAADCVPLLMADRRTGTVAAVHGGWRGLAHGAPAAAISALRRTFGVRPEDLVAAIGPSIGPCCYEVGQDVVAQFAERGVDPAMRERWFRTEPHQSETNPPMRTGATARDKRYLDLWNVTVDSLVASGVQRRQIWLAGTCTASHPAAWCSFRREGAGVGRIVAAIRPRGSAESG